MWKDCIKLKRLKERPKIATQQVAGSRSPSRPLRLGSEEVEPRMGFSSTWKLMEAE